MTTGIKFSLISFLIMVAIFISFFIYRYCSYRVEYLSYQINGKIEEISYCDKGFPTVKIKGKKYLFMYFWDRNITLQVGYSIYKNSSFFQMKIYNLDGTIKANLQ